MLIGPFQLMASRHPEALHFESEPAVVIAGILIELVPVPFAIYQVEIPR